MLPQLTVSQTVINFIVVSEEIVCSAWLGTDPLETLVTCVMQLVFASKYVAAEHCLCTLLHRDSDRSWQLHRLLQNSKLPQVLCLTCAFGVVIIW